MKKTKFADHTDLSDVHSLEDLTGLHTPYLCDELGMCGDHAHCWFWLSMWGQLYELQFWRRWAALQYGDEFVSMPDWAHKKLDAEYVAIVAQQTAAWRARNSKKKGKKK